MIIDIAGSQALLWFFFYSFDLITSSSETEMALFNQYSPAQTVHTLMDHLRSENRPGDLYRGQLREYPALVPSMFRAGIIVETADREMVSIDEDRVYQSLSGERGEMRRFLHSRLVAKGGLALGNILAQQYGVSSECLDLTADIRVAGFFATRNWPIYAHHRAPGVGVIYRFRRGDRQLTADHKSNVILSCWFELGDWEGKYFDSLIHRSNYDTQSLDRDKWLGFIPPQRAIVSTLPLRMSWEDVREVISNLEPREISNLWLEMPKYNHRRTRTFRQSGGFIRPRIFWEADIPSRHQLVPLKSMLFPSGFEGMPEFDESASRVTPSTAIKVKLVGIENVRLRPDCEAFYFHHSDIPVSGLYRRKLWPEPIEDPVYGLIWNDALAVMIAHTEETFSVDDPDKGLLDRGYRVAGEKQTMNAREQDDLMRGQLEDAEEAVTNGAPTPYDWVCISGGLFSAGDKRGSVRAAINAVRLNPFDVFAGTALAGALWQMGRDRWARIVLTRVEVFAPEHPDLLYNLAVAEIEEGKYQSAFLRLKKALKSFDQSENDLPRSWLVERLLFVAEELGEIEVASWAQAVLKRYMRSGGVVADEDVFEELRTHEVDSGQR